MSFRLWRLAPVSRPLRLPYGPDVRAIQTYENRQANGSDIRQRELDPFLLRIPYDRSEIVLKPSYGH
jgi:hypothetical protein